MATKVDGTLPHRYGGQQEIRVSAPSELMLSPKFENGGQTRRPRARATTPRGNNRFVQNSNEKMLAALSYYNEFFHHLVVMQVINGTVSLYDPSGTMKSRKPWYHGRAQEAKYIVEEALKTNRFRGDVEVLVHVSDLCDIPADEKRFGVLMLCPATGNSFQSHIPFPMWSRGYAPTGAAVWDVKDKLHTLDQAFKIRKPWNERKSQALFRGTLHKCGDANDVRGNASLLSMHNKDLLDAQGTNCGGDFIPMDQWDDYKYVLHLGQGLVEGNMPRWGDRLKLLYMSGSAVLQPEGDCNEFFTSHFKPGIDYIPVKRDLSDLIDQIRWAQAHDVEVQNMVEHMHAVAMRVLSHDAIVNYTLGVLDTVYGTMNYTVTKLNATSRLIRRELDDVNVQPGSTPALALPMEQPEIDDKMPASQDQEGQIWKSLFGILKRKLAQHRIKRRHHVDALDGH